jgi:SAM-dependent methyltransferase
LEHDRQKNRFIEATGQSYLHDLKITDAAGNVYQNAQDKYRQINKYVEILSTLIKNIPADKLRRVVDMGSGKGYLTFALYDYLHNTLHYDTAVTGVEYRTDLVDLCNDIAKRADFKKLDFVQGSIDDFDSNGTDILIALHACDTATDDAIAKGIAAGSELIVVAPCCHKQIRREIEAHKAINDLDFVMKHGIFVERQAEMVTDALRALILEYCGYSTKVFEFISDAHTPKNILIVGTRNPKAQLHDPQILQKIHAAKNYFGIKIHHLERAVGI